MKVIKYHHIVDCKDCGFYNDCPMDYLCPPAEILKFIADEQNNGRLRIQFREDLIKELGLDEEE